MWPQGPLTSLVGQVEKIHLHTSPFPSPLPLASVPGLATGCWSLIAPPAPCMFEP